MTILLIKDIELLTRVIPAVHFCATLNYNGIGSYEFWGQKCHDLGQLEISDITCTPPADATVEEAGWLETMIENGDLDQDIYDRCTELCQAEAEAQADRERDV